MTKRAKEFLRGIARVLRLLCQVSQSHREITSVSWRGERMIAYGSRLRCYNCREPIKERLYIEREARPDTYVPICDRCEPIWAAMRHMEERGLLQAKPGKGVVLAPVREWYYRQNHR